VAEEVGMTAPAAGEVGMMATAATAATAESGGRSGGDA